MRPPLQALLSENIGVSGDNLEDAPIQLLARGQYILRNGLCEGVQMRENRIQLRLLPGTDQNLHPGKRGSLES